MSKENQSNDVNDDDDDDDKTVRWTATSLQMQKLRTYKTNTRNTDKNGWLRGTVVECRDRRTFPVLRSTGSWWVITYVGKPPATKSAN